MRSKAEIFDNMLKITATMGYPFEKPFYQCNEWNRAKKIVDVGCGNAEYLSILAKENPDKSFFGIEKNSQLAATAYSRHNKDNITILNRDYKDLNYDFSFDFFIARRSIVHFNPRQEFYNWLLKHSKPSSSILVIETGMKDLNYDSSLPIFTRLCDQILSTSDAKKLSQLESLIEKEITEISFKHISTLPMVVNTSIPGVKENFYIYMRLIAEISLGNPIPSDLAEELFSWLINSNSYAEHHIHGSLFTRNEL